VRIGFAEVPMPVVFSFQPADNTVDFIHYAVHPDKPRALGFRWNQGPSSTGAVPPDLNAGYDVYEFDLDAHSPEDFSALRLIQEVDLLAADEVARTPHDTLVPDRWEAWYPAAFMRMQLARTQRLKVPLSNWYSWRDSILVWPPAQQTFSKPDRRAEMHSFLIRLVDALRKTEKDRDTVIVDVNPIPATIPGDLAAFMSETAPRIDPYGWRILQRMGLSICISLRRPEDGSYYSGAEVLKQIREQLAIFAAGNDENKQDYLALLPHLHVEHLFQPGQSVTLATSDDPQPGDVDERKVAETGLLDIVQISLRPYAQQVYHYASVEFVVPLASPQPFTDLVTFQVTDHNPITVIQYTSWSSSDSKSGGNQEQSVAVAEKDKVSVVAPVSLDAPINVPTDRQVKLLIRGESVGQAAGSVRVFFKGVELVQKPFEPSAPPSGYFTAPSGDLNRKFELIGDLAASQWELLRVYLTQAGVTRPAHLRDNISILSWLARFLDLSHDAKGTGPWLATGYPRLVSPVALTPDKSGRISYFHLVTDSYAHVFRYYVRPRGRYDLLWQSIVSSRLFGSADQPMKPLALALSPEKGTGGLDVVLDRIHEITPPLVLGSRRIDPKPATADPVPPGSIWEVIVAKHPEQELIERNRTLARHLSYRQIAYTMMRTFAYQKQLTELKTILKHQPSVPPYDFEKRQVEGPPTKPLLPGAYPAPETERLDLSKEEDLRALDLPERLGPFGQGAQVLQWRALPYFYKQRLLLVAQAAHIHSDATEILQQDFEYRSPVPNVLTEGFTRNTPPTPETVNPAGRVRRFHIELASYWKCLPPEARAQWKIENSDFVDPVIGNQTVKRMYSSLPELSAIYQFLLNGDAGVTEALNEVFYVPGTGFAARQFNKDIPLTVKEIEIPDRNVNHQAPMFLMALLTTSATITLRRIVDANGKPLPLGISGDFTRIDRNRILLPSIPDFEALASKPPANAPPENIDRFLARWYAARSVSHEVTIPRNLPLFGKVEFREADGFVLVQHGSQPAELDAWAATVDPALAASIQSLKTTDLTATTQVVVRKFLAQSDFPLSLRHQVAIKDDEVIWTGPVTPLQLTALDSMIAAMPAQGPGRRGLEDLRDRLHTDRSFPAQPERFPGAPPKQADLVALLSNPLTGIILDTFPAPENKFSIRWAGISNLGEPVEALLTRIAVKIPNPADNIRTALESIFREIAAFQSTGRIPGVPPALAAMVSLNRYLLHLNELPQDRQALIDLFANSPLDQAAVNRLYLDLEDQHTLDHYLAGWISEQPISASKVFPQSASWQDRIEFPLPNSCVLAVSVPLTGGEIAQLMAIDADVGFKEALQQLASGRRTAQAPVGLEQLIELAPAVEIPTSANRNITWHGPLRRTMRATLTKWIATSPFNATLTALLAALGQWRFDDTFDATGEYPRQSELDPAIRSRLIVSAGTIGWNGLALDFDEEAALNALAADLSWSASFRAGVTKLLNTIRVSVAVVVPVTEADWKPRPRQGAVLPDKLLIGNALVRFHGLMTRDDGQALQKDQSAPDRAAIQRLFDASMRGGLNGGELVARARLGSAKIETSPLNTTLT
jgi:hypothetical protein